MEKRHLGIHFFGDTFLETSKPGSTFYTTVWFFERVNAFFIVKFVVQYHLHHRDIFGTC